MESTMLLSVLLFVFGTALARYDLPEESKVGIVPEIEVAIGSAHDSQSQYTLKLAKADESVLHPNIKVISLARSVDSEKQQIISTDSWTPSNADLTAAQNLYIDDKNLAAVRLDWNAGKGEHVVVSGVVNGNKIEGGKLVNGELSGNKSDYIDIGRNITGSKSRQSQATQAVVEVVLVCDKEFGDIFNHDRRRILDYFTVYFWDINLRYKTLPSSNISFRLNAIIIINSVYGQPFIEDARAADGRAEFFRILPKFGDWIYAAMPALPKFDMAIAITNAQVEWSGGLAYYKTACFADQYAKRHWGTLVLNDDGAWGSVTVGAHEIGHSLGAPHDDVNGYPGGCTDRGYIMSGGSDDLKYFFSTCSDRTIGEFVRSDEASCLWQIDETDRSPVISTDFTSVLAPSMSEQCKRRSKDPNAFVPDDDTSNCKEMKCWLPNNNDNGWLILSLTPVDNTPCGVTKRCFRGRCRKIGSVLMNVGTGQCAIAYDPFSHLQPLVLVPCPNPTRSASPLERFVVEDSPSNGKVLMTPYSSPNATENGEKCVYTGNTEGDTLWTDRCNMDNPWHGWNLRDVGNGEFLLYHRVSWRCAKPNVRFIGSYSACNSSDINMRWRLEQ